ncbi:MAG: hypothetical protein MI892_28890 [Desulfobacterales bacterium]|nr:hypothetical protein [Desulfobacterales bacterium]
MSAVTVQTKEELESAKNQEVDSIIVAGELADKLKKAQKITKLGAVGLGAVTAAFGLTAVTGGVGVVVVAPIAAVTGLEVAAIIAAAALGIGLIIALYKDYEEIEYSRGTLKLKRRQS